MLCDCCIRVYRSSLPFLCLHCFSGVFLHYTESKTYNFTLIIPKNYPIIPELFLILSTTYYSRNYSGIIGHNRRVPIADPVNPRGCTIRPVKPLGYFNKNAWGAKLLPTTVLPHPVGVSVFVGSTRYETLAYYYYYYKDYSTYTVNLAWLQSSTKETTMAWIFQIAWYFLKYSMWQFSRFLQIGSHIWVHYVFCIYKYSFWQFFFPYYSNEAK